MPTIGIYEPTSFTWDVTDAVDANPATEAVLYGSFPYTAGDNEKVTKIRAVAGRDFGASSSTFVRVCLINSLSDPADIEQVVEFTNMPEVSGGIYPMLEAVVDWPLTSGDVYTLSSFRGAAGEFGAVDTTSADSERVLYSADPPEIADTINPDGYTGARTPFIGALVESSVVGPDYTARKGATGVEVTHTLTADGITSQTLNGEVVTLASQAGQVATLNLDESAITTSGEYDLVLGDGVGTQTFTVQYNVIGISSKNLNKDGLDLASLDNLEIIVATLGGLQLARYTNKLTTPQGDTGTVLVNTGSALDMVNVSFISGDLNYTQKTELEVI